MGARALRRPPLRPAPERPATSSPDPLPPGRAGGPILAPLAVVLLLLTGCRQEMYDQPRYEAMEPSALFADGTSARPLEPGTVPRGGHRLDAHLYEGRVGGKDAETFPFPIDHDAIVRGQQRYRIYCTPCHGELGDGRGMIVQRGFSQPPPFYGARSRSTQAPKGGGVSTYEDLRAAPVGHFYRVMTYGHGAMYSYAARITPEDRWKIAAYIRALQLSQHATVDDLKGIPAPTAEERRLLKEAAR